jgi:hypothetical protein
VARSAEHGQVRLLVGLFAAHAALISVMNDERFPSAATFAAFAGARER